MTHYDTEEDYVPKPVSDTQHHTSAEPDQTGNSRERLEKLIDTFNKYKEDNALSKPTLREWLKEQQRVFPPPSADQSDAYDPNRDPYVDVDPSELPYERPRRSDDPPADGFYGYDDNNDFWDVGPPSVVREERQMENYFDELLPYLEDPSHNVHKEVQNKYQYTMNRPTYERALQYHSDLLQISQKRKHIFEKYDTNLWQENYSVNEFSEKLEENEEEFARIIRRIYDKDF